MFASPQSAKDGFEYLSSLPELPQHLSAGRMMVDRRSEFLAESSMHLVSEFFNLLVAHGYRRYVREVPPHVGSCARYMSDLVKLLVWNVECGSSRCPEVDKAFYSAFRHVVVGPLVPSMLPDDVASYFEHGLQVNLVGGKDRAPAVFKGGAMSFAVPPVYSLYNFHCRPFHFEKIRAGFIRGGEGSWESFG